MTIRLMALDEGPDIPIDRAMVVVGRHPQCDARLDSIRVSRRHCCMTPDNGEVVVRDLGSTNGIRINGQRVEMGRLRPGDELSIAHIRFRLDDGASGERTVRDPVRRQEDGHRVPFRVQPFPTGRRAATRRRTDSDNPLAAAVRNLLPAGIADRCRIQVIVQMRPEADGHSGDELRAHASPTDPLDRRVRADGDVSSGPCS